MYTVHWTEYTLEERRQFFFFLLLFFLHFFHFHLQAVPRQGLPLSLQVPRVLVRNKSSIISLSFTLLSSTAGGVKTICCNNDHNMTCFSLVATLGNLQKTQMRTPGAQSLLQGCNICVKDILIICHHQYTYLQVFKAQDSQSDRRGSDGSSEKNCLILLHSVVISNHYHAHNISQR